MKNSIGLNKERKAAEKIETASLYDVTIYSAPHFKINLMKLFLMVFVILSLTSCYGTRAAHKHHNKGGRGINSYEHFDKPGKY
jgi:hypothetical protein